MITLPYPPFSEHLGLVEFYNFHCLKYQARPYLNAAYWDEFDEWLLAKYDIQLDLEEMVLLFKSEEQKTMFLLTHSCRA